MYETCGDRPSGGDCPGLNATIRGAAKALYSQRFWRRCGDSGHPERL